MLGLSDFTVLEGEEKSIGQVYEENIYDIHGVEIKIREFEYSSTNAGIVWSSSFPLCEYITENIGVFKGKRIVELGAATGLVSIYLKKRFDLDVTTSDITNSEIEENIKHNCELNDVQVPHFPHLWGDEISPEKNKFDIVLASDILIYENHYEELLKTLSTLLGRDSENSFMIMTYKRKPHREKLFWQLLEENGFAYELLGSKTWKIVYKKKVS
eukprot:TRINITY_DN1612_c0_g2_i1.p1 TRINITY_DN1612_c0_g2~~TRINITY_DN1612_c0_g2_i1.p1  ORF type:complete len:237 (-),score=61.03 TRINITY_DN1612_c0_g2_i1:199-840(-)